MAAGAGELDLGRERRPCASVSKAPPHEGRPARDKQHQQLEQDPSPGSATIQDHDEVSWLMRRRLFAGEQPLAEARRARREIQVPRRLAADRNLQRQSFFYYDLVPDYRIWDTLRTLGCFELRDGCCCLVDAEGEEGEPEAPRKVIVQYGTVEEIVQFLLKFGIPNSRKLSPRLLAKLDAQVKTINISSVDLRSAQLQADGWTHDDLNVHSDRVVRPVMAACGFYFNGCGGIFTPGDKSFVETLEDAVRFIRSQQERFFDAGSPRRVPVGQNETSWILIKKKRELAIRIWAAASSVPLDRFDWETARRQSNSSDDRKPAKSKKRSDERLDQRNSRNKVRSYGSTSEQEHGAPSQRAVATLQSSTRHNGDGKDPPVRPSIAPASSLVETAFDRRTAPIKTKLEAKKENNVTPGRKKGAGRGEARKQPSARRLLRRELKSTLARLNKAKEKRGLAPTTVERGDEKSRVVRLQMAALAAEAELADDNAARERALLRPATPAPTAAEAVFEC